MLYESSDDQKTPERVNPPQPHGPCGAMTRSFVVGVAGPPRDEALSCSSLSTPRRPRQRVPLRQLPETVSRKQLFEPEASISSLPWSEKEVKALVEFILFHDSCDRWPSTKNTKFWKAVSLFVHQRSGADMSRTG